MSVCTKCGSENEKNARFCHSCSSMLIPDIEQIGGKTTILEPQELTEKIAALQLPDFTPAQPPSRTPGFQQNANTPKKGTHQLPEDKTSLKTGQEKDTIFGFKIGEFFANRYRILEILGKGGMGMVLKVADTRMNNSLRALKLMKPKYTESEEAKARFTREAELAMRLTHEGIVRVYHFDFFIPPNNPNAPVFHYLVMEYIEGIDLAKWIKQQPGKIKLLTVLDIIIQVCDILAYAHSMHMIHRDIKPANIILCADGKVKLLDFGIAIMEDSMRLTAYGMGVGTQGYSPPEQNRGDLSFDCRKDIYSIGVVLHELLVKRLPAQLTKPLRSIRSDITDELEYIIRKATEETPEARYQTVTMMRDALQEIKAQSLHPKKQLKTEIISHEPPPKKQQAESKEKIKPRIRVIDQEPESEVTSLPAPSAPPAKTPPARSSTNPSMTTNATAPIAIPNYGYSLNSSTPEEHRRTNQKPESLQSQATPHEPATGSFGQFIEALSSMQTTCILVALILALLIFFSVILTTF